MSYGSTTIHYTIDEYSEEQYLVPEVKAADGQENTENAEISTPVNAPKVTSIRVETYGIDYGMPETLTPFDYTSWMYKQYGIGQ